MGLTKKDRRISIWIGITIGVTLSSILFRYAIQDKNERTAMRPGSYDSNLTAIGGLPFPKIPSSVRKVIPRGLVLYFESNYSITSEQNFARTDCWVIESGGALRSERLFILAEVDPQDRATFYRASELYLTAEDRISLETLERELPSEKFRILGQNRKTSEYILQTKEFEPRLLKDLLEMLPRTYRSIRQARLYPWSPPN